MNKSITYNDIVNDFNKRSKVYEGTHSLVNFATQYYPKQSEAFCHLINRICNGENVDSDVDKPLDDI